MSSSSVRHGCWPCERLDTTEQNEDIMFSCGVMITRTTQQQVLQEYRESSVLASELTHRITEIPCRSLKQCSILKKHALVWCNRNKVRTSQLFNHVIQFTSIMSSVIQLWGWKDDCFLLYYCLCPVINTCVIVKFAKWVNLYLIFWPINVMWHHILITISIYLMSFLMQLNQNNESRSLCLFWK